MEDIMVSIVCNTYNHGKYIEQTIQSFLMQKTNFKFEILIHDDASTDNTADIIRKYENKYPELIKPIYQTENQYSKKVKISDTFQFPRAKGKYIAICEGDDYWTDENKLQKQVDALEENPEVDICTHRTLKTHNEEPCGEIVCGDKKRIIPFSEVVKGGGGFVATNSLMVRTKILGEVSPVRKYMTLDYIWQMEGAAKGGMLYLPECMSTYRVMTEGSWSSRMAKDVDKYTAHLTKVIKALEILNEYLEFKHEKILNLKIKDVEAEILIAKGEYKKLLNFRYREVFKNYPLIKKIKILIKAAINY